jgi:uncharacterized SAM-dependent methyltransferase
MKLTPEQKQAQAGRFGNAIMQACDDTAKAMRLAGENPELPCLLGALVSVIAHHLAGVPDTTARQRIFADIGNSLAEMTDEAAATGQHAAVELIKKGPMQ